MPELLIWESYSLNYCIHRLVCRSVAWPLRCDHGPVKNKFYLLLGFFIHGTAQYLRSIRGKLAPRRP